MKIAFCVFACATKPRYKDEIKGILNSWGRRVKRLGHILYFFLGEEKTDLEGENFVYLPGVQNDYLSASHKQNLGLKMIYEKHRNEYDYVYTCGTDTYVNLENLLDLVNKFNTNEAFMIGGDGGHRTVNNRSTYFSSGGPGLVISKKAMELIYPLLEKMFEKWRKLCEESNKKDLIGACDVALAYYAEDLGIKQKIENALFYHCNYREKRVNINKVVATHFVKKEDFEKLHQYYYG